MKKPTFEQALEQLKNTVEKLETGSVTLEESVKLYEEGMKLSLYCDECLKNARQKITELSLQNGEKNDDK